MRARTNRVAAAMAAVISFGVLGGCEVSDGLDSLTGCLYAAKSMNKAEGEVFEIRCAVSSPVTILGLPMGGASGEELVKIGISTTDARLIQESAMAASKWCTLSRDTAGGADSASQTERHEKTTLRCVESSIPIAVLLRVVAKSSVKMQVRLAGGRPQVIQATADDE